VLENIISNNELDIVWKWSGNPLVTLARRG